MIQFGYFYIFIVLAASSVLLTGCVEAGRYIIAHAQSEPLRVIEGAPQQLSDEDLLILYGRFLRQNYKDSAGTSADVSILAIEDEIDRRGILTSEQSILVEKGVVGVGQSRRLLMASIDLVEKDIFSEYGDVVRLYMGPIGHRNERDYVMTCNDVVVGVHVTGNLTPNTKNARTGSRSMRVQTNFPNGYWSDPRTLPDRMIGGRFLMRWPQRYTDMYEFEWSYLLNTDGLRHYLSSYWRAYSNDTRLPFIRVMKGRKSFC